MAYANVPNDFGVELAVILMILQRFSGSWAKQVLTPTHIVQSKHKGNNLHKKQTTLLTPFNIRKDNNTFKYTHRTILLPLYRSTCPCWHPELRTGGYRWSKVLLSYAVAHSSYLEFSSAALSTLSPYYTATILRNNSKIAITVAARYVETSFTFLSVSRSRVT